MSENISLQTYLHNNYNSLLETVTELSKTDKKEFIKNTTMLYNFDKMICSFYRDTNKPKSADALYIIDNVILFIEFKTGFKDKVTIRDIDENKFCCHCMLHNICKEKFQYYIQYKDLHKKDKSKSLFLKIAESYIFFKENFLPIYMHSITEGKYNYKFKFWIVVDSPVDAIQAGYKKNNNENEKKTKNNIILGLQEKVKRFYDKTNKSYYEEILVLNQYEFTSKLDKLLKKA